MKSKFLNAYMETAFTFANLSSAERLKVGCVIVKNDAIISFGYNGTPSGWDNCCEDKDYPYDGAASWIEIDEMYPLADEDGDRYRLKTKPEVLHAEANAISKLAKGTTSSEGSTLFCTHEPCIECAKLIYQAGIKEVYYAIDYNASKGSSRDFFSKSNIKVSKLD